VVGTQLGAWPDWVRGATDLNVIGAVDTTRATAFPVTLAALVGAAALAWRRWYGPALRLDLFALALVGATYVAATRIVGDVFPYIVRWTWAVGALAWIAIGWTLVSWLREPVRRSDPRVGRAVVGLGVAAVIVSSAVGVVDALDAGTPEPEASPRIARLTAAVEQELARHPGDGVVEIQMMDSPDSIFGGAGSIWTGAGIANLLDQRGYDVRVSPDLEFAYGRDWVVDPDEAVRLRVLPADTPEVGLVRDRGDYDQIARAGHTHVFVEPGAPR
jgi:hypothetical protein